MNKIFEEIGNGIHANRDGTHANKLLQSANNCCSHHSPGQAAALVPENKVVYGGV